MRSAAGHGARVRGGSAGDGSAGADRTAARTSAAAGSANAPPPAAAPAIAGREEALARYGTDEPAPPVRRLTLGPVSFLVADGAVRSLAYEETEAIRGLVYPVRDADWGTLATTTLSEEVSEAGNTLFYRRIFAVGYDFDGDLRVTVTLDGRNAGVAAALCLAALRDVATNRAGFVVLHPIGGVAGEPVERHRPDGRVDRLAFPRLVSPAQPVRDIGGLAHVVDGVAIDIRFDGEVFEMEDQRNWTDASFKTYCRPLSAPRPYTVPAGERVEQQITVSLRPAATAPVSGPVAATTAAVRAAAAVVAERRGAGAEATVPAGERIERQVSVRLRRAAPAPSPAPEARTGAAVRAAAAVVADRRAAGAEATVPAMVLALDETIAPSAAAAPALAAIPFAGVLARLRADEVVCLRADEVARLRADEMVRLRADEIARLRADEIGRPRAVEIGRPRAVEIGRPRADEIARPRAVEIARLRADEIARLRADEEVRRRRGQVVRSRPDGAAAALAAARTLALPVTLEVVIPEGTAPAAALASVAAAAAAAGIAPRRVVALPEAYLASIQPDGPWPSPTPDDAADAARAAFPASEIGAGMLTYFTEFNRRPPRGGAFATFGTAAIVHAADDASVLGTLEALPDVFASAAALAGDRPLHLGLVAIGMRANPYGASLAPNPGARRVAMALADPRQRGLFAAAFAVGAVAAAAEAGVASLALGMADGPLGLTDRGAARPVFHVARALARLSGRVTVKRSAGGLVRVGPVVANLGAERVALAGAEWVALTAATVAAARDPLFLDRAVPGPASLAPLDVAFLVNPVGDRP